MKPIDHAFISSKEKSDSLAQT